MRKILITAFTAFLSLACCRENIPVVEQLHVEGTELMNASGEKVQLKGVSLGWHNLWPRFYNDGAVHTLVHDWGAEVVRAAIGVELDGESFLEWKQWMDSRGISYAMWSLSDKLETCSMLVPFASSEGPWKDEYIKPWGRMVKDALQ